MKDLIKLTHKTLTKSTSLRNTSKSYQNLKLLRKREQMLYIINIGTLSQIIRTDLKMIHFIF